ncbi:hypothetical protein AB0M22_22295 [Nocardia sp. NPDC051756]|uniref:hypothetical protein n=1 Tax=Nocardia sp. NPDC051756 TaxID=3154751 RepID=UPI00343A7057
MAAERRIQVDTARLRQAAEQMDEVGTETKEIITNLRNTIQAQGFPWGRDDYGDKFAKGGKGYSTSETNLLAGGDNMADSAGKFATGMRDAADTMDKMDDRAR